LKIHYLNTFRKPKTLSARNNIYSESNRFENILGMVLTRYYTHNTMKYWRRLLLFKQISFVFVVASLFIACSSENSQQKITRVDTYTPRKSNQGRIGNNTKLAHISWFAPAQRENGKLLYLYEIASYQIEIKASDNSLYINENLTEDGSGSHNYSFELQPRIAYTFSIATRDIDGLYSETFTTDIYQEKAEKKW